MARLVSLGSSLQDIYLLDREDFAIRPNAPSLFSKFAVGSKIDIDRITYEVGGGGTNSATTFARHGHQSILLSSIGRDSAGEAIIASLDQEGIDSSYLTYSRSNTGCSIVLLDMKSGERTILTCRGASAKFSDLDETDLELIRPDWLYITTLRGDFDTLRRFIKKAKELDVKVMFNPGKLELEKKKSLLRILSEIDVLLINQGEARSLVLGSTLPELLPHLSAYTETVIITAGGSGAIATNGKETYRFGLYEDIPVKDTTGAGDSFGSGFLAHLAAGNSFKESLIFASANSTFVVGQLGAHAGILTGKETLHPMPIQRV